jgi:hypothetical protein
MQITIEIPDDLVDEIKTLHKESEGAEPNDAVVQEIIQSHVDFIIGDLHGEEVSSIIEYFLSKD